MNWAQRAMVLWREAALTAWAQPVASIVSIVIVAGMCASVLLTTGRTVGAEDAVLASIDSAGTRSIIVRAEMDAGLDSSVLDRLANLDGIESTIAFGPSTDIRNIAFEDGVLVPLRLAWGLDRAGFDIPADGIVDDTTGWASARALNALGMLDASGGLVTNDGRDFAIAGQLSVPEHLGFLEPVIVIPQTRATVAPVSVLVVIAEQPALVSPVSRAVQSLLAIEDPTKVTITTSETLATLRALVEGQLGSFGRDLILVIFGLSAVFVASILYAFTTLRRKDYGRRRALGAARSLIIQLILIQMLLLAVIGAVLGSAGALVALMTNDDPVPQADFIAAVALLACTVAVLAAVLPAVTAARRDPIRELRVP